MLHPPSPAPFLQLGRTMTVVVVIPAQDGLLFNACIVWSLGIEGLRYVQT